MLVNQIDELLDTSFSSPKLFVQNNLLDCLPYASLLNVREFATSENYLWQIFKNLKQELKNCENKITIYSQLVNFTFVRARTDFDLTLWVR